MIFKFMIVPLLLPPVIEDIRTREIRNIYWVIIILSKCIFLIVRRDRDELISSLLGLAVSLLIFIVSYLILHDGIGLGDVKLLSAVAFFLGLELFLRALLFISVISLLYSTFLLAVKKVTKKTALPFAPFIMAGTFVASYFFHVNIMHIILVDAIIGFLLMRDPQYN